MSQATTWGLHILGPASAAQFGGRGNESLNALMTHHRGVSRPAYLTEGMWLKTTSSILWELFYYTGSVDVLLATVNPVDGSVAWRGSGASLQGAQAVRVIYASDSTLLEAGTTYYFGPRGFSFVEADQSFAFPFDFTMRNLRTYSSPAPGVSCSIITTLRKNAQDTALTAMILDGAQQGVNTLDSVACVAGDLLSFEVQTSAGSGMSRVAVSAEMEIS